MYIELCVHFLRGMKPAIFCNHHAHAFFPHILHAYVHLFWCSIGVSRCRFHTRYKMKTKIGPDNTILYLKPKVNLQIIVLVNGI